MDAETETTAPKKKSAMKGCLLWGGGLFFGLVVLAAIVGPQDDSAPADGITAEEQAASDAALPEVAASQLIAAFESNEIAALRAYGDMRMKVTGQVLGVQADMSDNPLISIGGPEDFLGANAALDGEHADFAATLSKGSPITLVCDGVTEVIGMPQLKNCRPAR